MSKEKRARTYPDSYEAHEHARALDRLMADIARAGRAVRAPARVSAAPRRAARLEACGAARAC